MKNSQNKVSSSITVVVGSLTFIVIVAICSDYGGMMQMQLGTGNKVTIAGEKALPYLKDIK